MTAAVEAPIPARARLRDHPPFIRFWLARLAGTAAMQMLMVALGWQMYDATGSAWDLGLVGLYQFAPALALTLVVGQVVDRYHRGVVLALSLALQAATAVVLAVAATEGTVSRGLILGLSIVVGTAKAFQMPAQQALLPMLVPAPVLPRAMAFSASATQFAVIGGPALGGLLYAAGPAVVYGTCTALFVAAAVLASSVRHAHAPMREVVTLDSLLAGFRFIAQRKVVLGAISLDLFAVLLGGATALLPIFARDILHVGPWGMGLLRAAPAAGALAMSIALARAGLHRRVGPVLFGSVAVYGVAQLAFGLSTSFVISLLALCVAGAADMLSVVIRQTLVQIETPNEMRGRVSAVNSMFIGASNQLGEFESGATAALLGPVGSVVLGGAGTLVVVGLWMRWFPQLARRDRMEG